MTRRAKPARLQKRETVAQLQAQLAEERTNGKGLRRALEMEGALVKKYRDRAEYAESWVRCLRLDIDPNHVANPPGRINADGADMVRGVLRSSVRPMLHDEMQSVTSMQAMHFRQMATETLSLLQVKSVQDGVHRQVHFHVYLGSKMHLAYAISDTALASLRMDRLHDLMGQQLLPMLEREVKKYYRGMD